VSRPRLLLVEDEHALADVLADNLREECYDPVVARAGHEALRTWREGSFDLVVLDVMLPEIDGVTLCRTRRQEGDDTPVLFLSARGRPDERVEGLAAGGDDYLAKPFEPRELLLRLTNILKRIRTAPEVNDQALLRLGEHVFDSRRRELSQNGRPVRLTSAEIALLGVLADQPGQPMSREEMMERTGIGGSLRSIDVQVTRLRRKVEPDAKAPRYLQTVRGEGYVMRPDG
jgi:two-component system phosphate regulon response regulator OmpR